MQGAGEGLNGLVSGGRKHESYERGGDVSDAWVVVEVGRLK